MAAVIYENYKMCCLLLHHGADVNIRSDTQKTALYYAAARGGQITSLLLRNGAEIQKPIKTCNEVDSSPLGSAIIGSTILTRNAASFRLLLDHCIGRNIKVALEPLFEFTIEWERQKCAKIILQRGYYPVRNELDENFCKAAQKRMVKLMRIMINLNPQFMQEEWLVLKCIPSKLAKNVKFVSWLVECRKQPPNLLQLCRSTILTQLESYYLAKIDALPLPKSLKTFLATVE